MITKMLKTANDQKKEQRKAEIYRDMIRKEAKLGGELFGPVPKGHRREFFCLDERTWVWHEEWIDAAGQRRTKTTRYDVRKDSILKAQDGQPYQTVSPEEMKNLYQAAILYGQRVNNELYAGI